jgi:hypothetical protein
VTVSTPEEKRWQASLVALAFIGVTLAALRAFHIIETSWLLVTLPLWLIPAFFAGTSLAIVALSLITGDWWSMGKRPQAAFPQSQHTLN